VKPFEKFFAFFSGFKGCCFLKDNAQFLLFLAVQSGGLHSVLKTSTAKISKELGISQQTVSRKLRELKESGLIFLNASPSGCSISLTTEGIELLRFQFFSLQKLFQQNKSKVLHGRVKIGLGEGRYYISRPFYLKQFKKFLGFRPFFGTLNLEIDQAELAGFVSAMPFIEILGFETGERSFGKIRAFKVLVEGKQPAAIIFPERTAHKKNEIEVISSLNLRKKFGLKEGSSVSVSRA